MKTWLLSSLFSFGVHSLVAASVVAFPTGGQAKTQMSVEFSVLSSASLEDSGEEESPAPSAPEPEPAPKTEAPSAKSASAATGANTEAESTSATSDSSDAPIETGLTLGNAPTVEGGPKIASKAGPAKGRPGARALFKGQTACDDAGAKPRPLDKGPIPYPASLQRAGVEGRVILRVHVSATGAAMKVDVLKSVHPELDRMAQEAVSSWRFSPATRCGKPVSGTYTLARRFVLGS